MSEPDRMAILDDLMRSARAGSYADGLLEGAAYVMSLGDTAGARHLMDRAAGFNARSKHYRLRALAASDAPAPPPPETAP
jgi:hypothetical protein